MGTVNIAELKNQLSSFLHRVRSGEELIIRDRNVPVAKLVPLDAGDIESGELALVADGQMTLPVRELDRRRFWAIGGRASRSPKLVKAIGRAIEEDRDDHAGLLGLERHHPYLRPRSKRARS